MQQRLIFPNKISFSKGDSVNKKVLTIEPCSPGYGTTIGNSLRRVLLSSLSGGAVVAVKIKGAKHEFDTLKYIHEDVLEIILNIKNLRFKVHSNDTERLKATVSVTGEKVVTGADIKTTSDFEVANPNFTICHLTDKSAEFEMELFIAKGMGYSPTESRHKEMLELGTIAIDAIFSPVLNCSFQVENVRVGELTNYDKIIMTIHTDGTMTPEEAVKEGSQILIDHFMLLTGEKEVEPLEEEILESAPRPLSGLETPEGKKGEASNSEYMKESKEKIEDARAKEPTDSKSEDMPDEQETGA